MTPGLKELEAAVSQMQNGPASNKTEETQQNNEGEGSGEQGSEGQGEQNQQGQNQATAQGAEIDLSAKFKEKFGIDVEGVEELRKEAALSKQYKEIIDADPFDGDAEVKAIYDLKKKGLSTDVALKYLSIDRTKMTPKEQVIMFEQLDKPTIPLAKIIKAVDQKYQLGDYAPKNDDNEPLEEDGLDRIALEVAGQDGIGAKLDKLKETLVTPAAKPRSAVVQEQNTAALKTDWEKTLPAITAKLKAFEYKVPGLESPVKVELDLSTLTAEFNDMIEAAAKRGNPVNDHNLAIAARVLEKEIFFANKDRIILEAVKAANGKLEVSTLDDLHNPSGAKKPAPVGENSADGLSELKSAVQKMNQSKK